MSGKWERDIEKEVNQVYKRRIKISGHRISGRVREEVRPWEMWNEVKKIIIVSKLVR